MAKKFDEEFIAAINATKRRSGRRLSREAVASVGKRGIFGMTTKAVKRHTHKDVEYQVDDMPGTYKTFDEAAGVAIARAASTGRKATIDVLVWSRAGARHYGDNYGVEIYEEDPEASVFERIEIRADSMGRIP